MLLFNLLDNFVAPHDAHPRILDRLFLAGERAGGRRGVRASTSCAAPCPGCSGVDWAGYSVRDVVKIPADLAPGKYILGFRYDCEATARVWSNCADVTLE